MCFSSQSPSSPAWVACRTFSPWTATAAGNQKQNKEASLVVGKQINSSSEPLREFKAGTGKKWALSDRGRPAGTRGHELAWWTSRYLCINHCRESGHCCSCKQVGTWGPLPLGKGDLAALLPATLQGRDRPSHRAEGLEEKGHQAESNGGEW